ncbi:MAG TPA: PQQ-binding-like beta-propeller repeat protein [Edaphobacter sp.]|nr:PQQ-binding-like beta-propeller repeat protein [Edaphobacter sp.]
MRASSNVKLFAMFMAIAAPALVSAQATKPLGQEERFLQQSGQTLTPSSTPARGGGEGAGSTIFGNYCENCHGNPKVAEAPSPATLRQMTPEKIYSTLTEGDMKTIAKDLSDGQKRDIAEWVGGRKLGAEANGDAKAMSNPCANNPPVKDLTSVPSWSGWSPDVQNTRMQSSEAAKISPAGVRRMKLKWAFGVPSASSVYGQPTVVDGRVFFSSDAGYIYSLDATTGCVHWSFKAQTGVRSAISIGPIKPGSTKYAAFFGDIRGNVYSIDASTGEQIWKVAVDEHPLSRITGATLLYNGVLYVPVSSLEEPESSSANYLCCTFRGMIAALDSSSGKQVWKTYTLPDKPIPRTTPDGRKYIGTGGVGVWGPIAIDAKRHALYIGTGNTFSGPDVGRSDAIMALDMNNGGVLWVQQDEPEDVWHTGCGHNAGSPANFPPLSTAALTPQGEVPPKNAAPATQRPAMPSTYYCPSSEGPDWDFSAGAMLVTLPNGKDLVVAGQKSGMAWAHDPDKKGALVWKSDISRGQIVFGGAADQQYAYFPMRGGMRGNTPAGGVVAVRLTDGVEQWYRSIPAQQSMWNHSGFTAAATVIPGVVFTAGLDGMLRAFTTMDGTPIWEFDTTQDLPTVNGVKGKGGSIGSAGPTVANGMVFVSSGYTGFEAGAPGNLILAFGQ